MPCPELLQSAPDTEYCLQCPAAICAAADCLAYSSRRCTCREVLHNFLPLSQECHSVTSLLRVGKLLCCAMCCCTALLCAATLPALCFCTLHYTICSCTCWPSTEYATCMSCLVLRATLFRLCVTRQSLMHQLWAAGGAKQCHQPQACACIAHSRV